MHPKHPDPCVLFPSSKSSVCVPFPSFSIAKILGHAVLISCPNCNSFPVYPSTLWHEIITYSSWVILPILPLTIQRSNNQVKMWNSKSSFPYSHFSHSVVVSFAISQRLSWAILQSLPIYYFVPILKYSISQHLQLYHCERLVIFLLILDSWPCLNTDANLLQR